jgi:hypothetical protein
VDKREDYLSFHRSARLQPRARGNNFALQPCFVAALFYSSLRLDAFKQTRRNEFFRYVRRKTCGKRWQIKIFLPSLHVLMFCEQFPSCHMIGSGPVYLEE